MRITYKVCGVLLGIILGAGAVGCAGSAEQTSPTPTLPAIQQDFSGLMWPAAADPLISVSTATPAPEPVPTSTPYVVTLPPPEAPAAPEYTDVQERFFQGYRDAGGLYDEAHISGVIRCESNWYPTPAGYHLGLAQFAPGTWDSVAGRTGLWDHTDPYAQGYNMAVWSSLVDPGTRAGWPWCWWNG